MRKLDNFDEVRALPAGGQVWTVTVPASAEPVCVCVPAQGLCQLAVAQGQSNGEYLVHRSIRQPADTWVVKAMDHLVSRGQANAPLSTEPLEVGGKDTLRVFFRNTSADFKLVATCLGS